MFLHDHMIATDETAIYPGVGQGDMRAVTYLALGLAGEASEALEKYSLGAGGLVGELGDVLWYASRLHRELKLDPTEALAVLRVFAHDTRLDPATELVVTTGRAAEIVKKAIRDDGGVLTDARRDKLALALGEVLSAWFAVHGVLKVSPEDTAQANLAKLRGRKARGTLSGSGDER